MSTTEVVTAFERCGGRGPIPTEEMVEPISQFLTLGSAFGLSPSQWRILLRAQEKVARRQTNEDRFREALATIIETGPKIARERVASFTNPHTSMLYALESDPGDAEARQREITNNIEELMQFWERALALQETFPPWPTKARRVRTADWHSVAMSLAAMVIGAYRLAGRKQVSLTKPDAPAVKFLVWALGSYGYSVSLEAVAQHFARADRASRKAQADYDRLRGPEGGTTPPS